MDPPSIHRGAQTNMMLTRNVCVRNTTMASVCPTCTESATDVMLRASVCVCYLATYARVVIIMLSEGAIIGLRTYGEQASASSRAFVTYHHIHRRAHSHPTYTLIQTPFTPNTTIFSHWSPIPFDEDFHAPAGKPTRWTGRSEGALPPETRRAQGERESKEERGRPRVVATLEFGRRVEFNQSRWRGTCRGRS